MIKLCTLLIILFTGIQMYAFSTEKIGGIVSLEAIRQVFFVCLLGFVLFSLFSIREKFLVNKHALNLPMFLFFALLVIGLLRCPNYFYGMVDIVKITYVILATIVFIKFFSIYQYKDAVAFIDKAIIIAFLLFCGGILFNLFSGNIISADTGEFLLGGLSGATLGAIFCSILSIYFYNNYLSLNKLHYFILFLVSSLLVFLAMCRIVIAGFLLSFLLINFYYRKLLIPVILGLIAGSLFISTPYIHLLIKETFKTELISIYEIDSLLKSIHLRGREKLWPQAIESFLASPIIGNGTGYSTFVIKSDPDTAMLDHLHSDYLKMLSDHGIIGFILYLGIYLTMFIKAKKFYLYNKNLYKPTYVIFTSILIQILIFSITESVTLMFPYIGVYVFLFYVNLIYNISKK